MSAVLIILKKNIYTHFLPVILGEVRLMFTGLISRLIVIKVKS